MGTSFGLSFETYRVLPTGEKTPPEATFRAAEAPGHDNTLPPCECGRADCTARGGRP